MDIKNRPLSTFELFKISLQAANQAFGSALAVIFTIILLTIIMVAISVGAIFIFGPLGSLLQIPVSLLVSFLNLVAMVAIIQILASKIEKTGITFGETFTSSVMPALYFIVSIIVSLIPFFVIGVLAVFSKSSLVLLIVAIVLGFLYLPFCFTLQVVTLRNEGPIGALVYSWQLGIAHYLKILWTLIVLMFCWIVVVLAIVCALKAWQPELFTADPQMMQFQMMMWMSSIPKLYLLLISIVTTALYWYAFLFMQGVMTALFLNLDYQHRTTQNRDIDLKLDNETPVIPSVTITPEIMVKQASVQTETDEHVDKHLEQVYTASDHTPQVIEQEEDRMPTILFDEDMARQLAQNELKIQEQQNKSQDDDAGDVGSIKMSHK